MKRTMAILLALMMAVSLAGCGRSGESDVAEFSETDCEIALIMESETIEGDPYNGGIWEGIRTYAQANDVTHKWFGVGSPDPEDCKAVMEQAVAEGARVIVVGGSAYENAVFEMEVEHLDVSFIIVDGPALEENDIRVMNDNMTGVIFKEEEAGYLAGYAAVMEGCDSLGFLGGRQLPAVERFGLGFARGAEDAAREQGRRAPKLKTEYLGHFQAGDDVKALAEEWYGDGMDVIFACCGPAGASVMEAAEQCGGKVIGVDTDQAQESGTVITSAVKNLSGAIEKMLTDYYNGEFPGEQVVTLGVAEGGTGLAMDTWRMTKFTAEDYEALCQKFIDGQIMIHTVEIEE